MSKATLYYSYEDRGLYYYIDEHYYNADSLKKISLRDELELTQLLQINNEDRCICEHLRILHEDGTISGTEEYLPLSQPVFVKSTTGWAIFITNKDSPIINAMRAISLNEVFNGIIEHKSDIQFINVPDLKLGSINKNTSYVPLKLPEFNFLLYTQLMKTQQEKVPLFENLMYLVIDGQLIKNTDYHERQAVKKVLATSLFRPSKTIKVKNPSSYCQYRDQGILTDVTFIVTDDLVKSEIKAHKIILAAASDYFNRLFTSTFKESTQSIITINNTNPQAFELLIKALYGENIYNAEVSILLSTIKLIEQYQITKLDSKSLLNNIEIPANDFFDFVKTVTFIYPEMDADIIDIIASKIKTSIDLSRLSTEFIKLILTSSHYLPLNSDVTRNILTNLKDKGINITL